MNNKILEGVYALKLDVDENDSYPQGMWKVGFSKNCYARIKSLAKTWNIDFSNSVILEINKEKASARSLEKVLHFELSDMALSSTPAEKSKYKNMDGYTELFKDSQDEKVLDIINEVVRAQKEKKKILDVHKVEDIAPQIIVPHVKDPTPLPHFLQAQAHGHFDTLIDQMVETGDLAKMTKECSHISNIFLVIKSRTKSGPASVPLRFMIKKAGCSTGTAMKAVRILEKYGYLEMNSEGRRIIYRIIPSPSASAVFSKSQENYVISLPMGVSLSIPVAAGAQTKKENDHSSPQ